MDVREILEWTLEKINFINENSDAITGIEIYNEIETYFGKTYHRIYFKIETEFKYDYFNNPEEPITAGIDFGPGPGSDAMPKGLSANTRPDENAALVAQYLPDLIQAASYKDAPDSFKRFVNYLASK